MLSPASDPRTYVIGAPIWLTVADDGTVSVSVDMSELDTAPFDGEPLYDGDDPIEIPDSIRNADSLRIRFDRQD